MAERNTVIRKGNRIIKTFGSHMDYVKELSIYKKLEASNLAPKLLDTMPDSIEHEYIEGISLEDALKHHLDDPEKLREFFELFTTWYSSYRDTVKLTLGEADFSKFILSDTKVTYIDFEHCKPGYAEEDIAALLRQLHEIDSNAETLFREISLQKLTLNPELLDNLSPQ